MPLKLIKKTTKTLLQLIIYIHVIHITNIILSKFNRHKESYNILQYSINIVYITRLYLFQDYIQLHKVISITV